MKSAVTSRLLEMSPELNAVSMPKKSFVMIQSMGHSKNLKKDCSKREHLQVPCIQSIQNTISPETITYLQCPEC